MSEPSRHRRDTSRSRSRSRSRSARRHRRHHHRHERKHRFLHERERKAEGTEQQKLENRAQVASRSRMWTVVDSDNSESSSFKAEKKEKKKTKKKKRRRTSPDRRDRRRRRRRSRSSSESNSSNRANSSNSSSSSNSSEEEQLYRKKKRKSKSSKEDKKGHRKRKEKKAKKTREKEGGSRKLAVDQDQYGKYGILRESDFHTKSVSFHAWLRDVKKMGEFNGPKWEAMELFKVYMEEYNTCTMPHEKYYDVEKYEMKRYQKQQCKALDKQKRAASDRALDAKADEERVRRERLDARGKKEQEEFRLVLQLMDKDKIEAMREQERLRAQMQLMYKSGNVGEARRLEQILNKVEEDPRFKR